jgi:hypothetical protein
VEGKPASKRHRTARAFDRTGAAECRCWFTGLVRFDVEGGAVIRFFPGRAGEALRASLTACLGLGISLSAYAVSAAAHATGTVAAPSRPAGVVPVTTCADDDGGGTLRSIIGTAVSGDTVDLRGLDCDTIVLQNGQIEIAVDALVIVGADRDALTIDGAEAGRIFLHGGDGTLTLQALTLTRGRVIDGNGGCVASPHGSIALVDAAVAGCGAHDASGQSAYAGGGGLYAARDIRLLRSAVSDNTASADIARAIGGGGLLTRFGADGKPGNVEVSASTITGNRVLSADTGSDVSVLGGGIDSSGTVTLTRSLVADNSVASAASDDEYESITEGGGVHSFGLSVLESTFSGNRVENSGGAMDVAGGAIAVRGTARIVGSTIEHNHAGILAGGVAQHGGVPGVSRLDIANSTVSHNTAGFYGAGLVIIDGLRMTHSTVAFNAVDETSPFGIGGILIGSNETTGAYAIHSSIVANNQAGAEAMLGTDLSLFLSEVPITIIGDHNLVGESSGLVLPEDTLGGDPLLLPLADYGGPTRTHALAAGSPAIDAGDNAAGLTSDQRGGLHLRTFGAAADIGAFEVQPSPDVIFRSSFDPAE